MTLTIVETRAGPGGVDTHADMQVAAALDAIGGLLGVSEFPATPIGYAQLLGWLKRFGSVCLVGIEGAGSYGAGLAPHVTAAGVRVVEVDRSDRQDRRRQGKRDSIEAHLTIVFAALAVSRWIERQTGWSIRKFVKTARRYRTIEIQAGPHIITAADPIPDDLRQALNAINGNRRLAH